MTSAEPMSLSFLDRLRRREPAALAEAVREHAQPLFRSARALGCTAAEAEDLVQDVFVTFLERIDSFEGRSQLRTWLFGVLHRKVQERRRASVKDKVTDALEDVMEARFNTRGDWIRPPADIERLLLSNEIGAVISGCLEGLALNQREAFVLKEVDGLATSEICKILGVSITNFGVLMHRARARLRECVEAKGWLK